MIFCEAAAGCDNLAAVAVSVLAPTGETITDDTGTAPVLRPAMTLRLCEADAVGADTPLLRALGMHVDVEPLLAEDVLELDPLTIAKDTLRRNGLDPDAVAAAFRGDA